MPSHVWFGPVARPWLGAVLALIAGCAPIDDDEPEQAEQAVAQSSASETTLVSGRLTQLVEGIAAAENLHITSDERLIVSGDDGLYQIEKSGQGYEAERLVSAPDCQFAGITEREGHLYANCYNFSNSYIYASPLATELEFRRIYTLDGVMLANGLSSAKDKLYVASTFLGQLLELRLDPSDGLRVVARRVFLNASGLLSNGLDLFEGALYWTDGGNLNRVPIGENGRAGRRRTLARRLTMFDDLQVDDENILVADYLGNAVYAYAHDGSLRASSAMPLTTPSAVLATHGRAGFPEGSLLVTEKSKNRLSLISVGP